MLPWNGYYKITYCFNSLLVIFSYLYQNFHPKDISLELRKILEFSLEALDWLCNDRKRKVLTVESQYNGSDATANGIGEAEALSAKQMVSNIIIGLMIITIIRTEKNYNFSRVLYSRWKLCAVTWNSYPNPFISDVLLWRAFVSGDYS